MYFINSFKQLKWISRNDYVADFIQGSIKHLYKNVGFSGELSDVNLNLHDTQGYQSANVGQ